MQTTYKRENQSMFKKRISIRQMEDMVMLGARIGKTTFFYGGAGLGKSEKMRQIADKMFPHRRGDNLCDVRLSDKEPQDIAGIPIPIEMTDGTVRTMYAVPDFWPTDPSWEGIIFLDELPNAILGTQHSAYQVILDHMAGNFKFPVGCVFVGAGNRATDNAGTTEMPGPLINRMIVCEVEYNLDVWIEDYAVPFKLHPHIIGFLKQFPEHFYTGDVTNRPENGVFASPRQWKTTSDIIFDYEKSKNEYITEVAIAGTVGEGLETQVMAYHLRAAELPTTEEIFSGETTKHELSREKNDLVYVLSQTCLRKLEEEVMNNSIDDETLIERAGNFLNFMFNNHYARNKDTLIALMIGLFRAQAGTESVLSRNPKRVKMIPALRKNCPSVMKLVMEYQTRYGEIMKDFSA